jgi:hypothetical protein
VFSQLRCTYLQPQLEFFPCVLRWDGVIPRQLLSQKHCSRVCVQSMQVSELSRPGSMRFYLPGVAIRCMYAIGA